ncbi:MAG: MarR family winged helix-turn-helix transcriptional regulator [Crocinitomicaceae bacterium]
MKVFDPKSHQQDVSGKIAIGFERISEAFRVLLWEHGKAAGLSPIQIQILIFIHYHDDDLCGVSFLAKEFNMAKPTISDAVKSLEKKRLLFKAPGGPDARSHVLKLTPTGKKTVKNVEGFADPIKEKVEQLPVSDQDKMLESIVKIIFKLNQTGIITIQRTCFACTYYQKKHGSQYCNLMQTVLKKSDLRLDCPEFVSKAV